jgi:hypothetical protein
MLWRRTVKIERYNPDTPNQLKIAKRKPKSLGPRFREDEREWCVRPPETARKAYRPNFWNLIRFGISESAPSRRFLSSS